MEQVMVKQLVLTEHGNILNSICLFINIIRVYAAHSIEIHDKTICKIGASKFKISFAY